MSRTVLEPEAVVSGLEDVAVMRERSSSAVVILASPKTLAHSLKLRLGATRNEIPCIREARDHPDRRAIPLCVTEAAIDAMSLAAIESMRRDTLYVSTGGGWSPTTEAAIRVLGERTDALLVAATDANPQGESFASRLRELAADIACKFQRLKPAADDWNDQLRSAVVN